MRVTNMHGKLFDPADVQGGGGERKTNSLQYLRGLRLN
jgi:hypothetical protein